MKKNLNILYVSLILIFFLSCKKDFYMSSNNSDAISSAQVWFKQNTPNEELNTAMFRKITKNKSSLQSKTSSVEDTIPSNADIKLIADWTNAKTYETLDKTIIEVPLLYDGIFMFNIEPLIKGKSVSKKKSITRLLFFKTAQKTEGYFMTIISGNEYLGKRNANPDRNTYLEKEAGFDGMVIYHDLSGKFNAAKRFEKQMVDNKLNLIKGQNPNKVGNAIPPGCYEQEIWEVFGQGCVEITPGWIHCDYVYSQYVDSYTVCGNGGNTQPSGGGGGSTTPTPPIDTLIKLKDSCLRATTMQVLGSSIKSDFQTLMHDNLLRDHKLILNFEDENLGDTTLMGYMTPFGTRRYDNEDYLYGTIHLNSQVLPFASKEYTTAIIYHEVLHAYLSKLGSIYNGVNHAVMAEGYVSMLSNALQSAYPSMTNGDSVALAWAGLQGTGMWNLKTPSEQQAFVNVQNKYKKGILGNKCN